MPIPMLPNDGNGQGNANNTTGAWIRSSDPNFLVQLVNNLPAGANNGTIDSIPDIWAKPLLFKMALYNNVGVADSLHEQVVGEWRAVLAMLALQEFRRNNFILSADPINLQNDNSELAKIFRDLIPRESFNGNKDAWLTDIYVIYYQKNPNDAPKPLAMTSPLTLIATAADYSNDLAGKLGKPWSTDGKTLTDPIKFITAEERHALREWLKNLNAGVIQTPTDLANDLSVCIQSYIDDLAPQNINAAPVNFVASNLGLTQGVSALLNNVAQPPAVNIAQSPFKLEVNANRTQKNLILISPEMARNFTANPEQLSVWPGIYASDITEESLNANARNMIGGVDMGNVEFRRPEDFFLDKIAVFSNPDTFIHDVKIRGAAGVPLDFILPIKRELLECFSPEEITQRISFSYAENEQAISLSFNFPLANNRTFTFKKTYRQVSNVRSQNSQGIFISIEIPLIALWPNMRRAGWHEYYLYYENYRAQDVGKRHIPADKMYYVEPWSLNGQNFPNHGVKNLLIEKLTDLPEALTFNYYANGITAEIGMMLLNLPAETPQNGSAWEVGVDFGTSSTMIYFKSNGNAHTPLILKPRLLKVTNPRDFTQSDINFMSSRNPSANANGSFLSIFHLRDLKGNIRPILDGHILNFINSDVFKTLGDSVRTNLKWQNAAAEVTAYIGQICRQILVEAAANNVSKIDWRFSYPTAFSPIHANAFQNICNINLTNAYQETGFSNVTPAIEMWQESKAAAYYFRTFGNAFQFGAGALCIDIGAGTTDITAISSAPNVVLFHTSVRYAGQSMFAPIYKNYNIFAPNSPVNVGNADRRQALIDEDMRNNSQNYIQNLNQLTAGGKNADTVKKVLQCSQLAVAGLFYYLGKILKMLHEKKLFNETDIPPVFIGGNGARIFDWLTCGAKDINNPFTAVLKKMLEVSSGLAQNHLIFNMSAQPKVEVARGMITGGAPAPNFFDQGNIIIALFGNPPDPLTYGSVLSGAEFTKTGKPHDSLDFINAQDMADGIDVPSLDELKKFIDAFNDFNPNGLWSNGIRFGDNAPNKNQNAVFFSDAHITQLKRDIRNSYAQWAGNKNINNISPEPVFIVELRNLIKLL